jgi:hypothetical protein
MDASGKTTVARSAGPRGFVPSIVDPLALSERSDSGISEAENPSKARLVLAAGRGEQPGLDRKLVDEAAAWITAKIALTLRRGAEEVGEYVLDRFFSGDPELAKSRSSHKSASFRALAEKCGTPELPISKTWLNNAVGVAVMLRRLPESAQAFKRLPPSYQETLLPLRDPMKVEMVARQVAAKEMSFRELRAIVAQERAKAPKADSRGRPPIPIILKTLGRALKLFASGGGKRSFSRSEIEALDKQQRRAAKRSAEELAGRIRDLIRRLK